MLTADHSPRQTKAIIDYIGIDKAKFAELMDIFFGAEKRLAQRSSNAVNRLAERFPQLIAPHVKKLLAALDRSEISTTLKRNIIRLFQFIDVPPALAGKLYSRCLELIDDPSEPIAVRSFAMLAAARVAASNDSLLRELRLTVKRHLPSASCAFGKDARKIGMTV